MSKRGRAVEDEAGPSQRSLVEDGEEEEEVEYNPDDDDDVPEPSTKRKRTES